MKTVNRGLSEQLEEAGYPQENTYWFWAVEMDKGRETSRWSLCQYDHLLPDHPKYASPTADEILDQLPDNIDKDQFYNLFIEKIDNEKWGIRYTNSLPSRDEEISIAKRWGNSLADATAKCWLYLKKEGLL